MGKKKDKGSGKGLERKGDGKGEEKKRMLILDQNKCKPGSEAFLFLQRIAQQCRSDCIQIQRQGQPGFPKVEVDESGEPASKMRIIIHEEACAACLTRAKKCPGNAVKIVNLPNNLTTGIIHRYGPNGFKLHGLPSPKAGYVLGLLGSNGIGKSTALKVLAGKLKPNLGQFEDPPSWQDIVTYHRGSDLQAYLTKLLEDDLKVVTKVQLDVDFVSKFAKGKVVGEILEKCDDRGVLKKLTKALTIDHLMQREIQQLSGGELQRFAICAVAAREADVYIFDEASSFLDIKQRIEATEVIRELSTLKGEDDRPKYVVVVEHDLAVLDYMADYVNCLYGEPGAYGVVTKIATNTVGINNYLAGYFPAENMRFRNEAITFAVKGAQDSNEGSAEKDEARQKSNKKLGINYPDMSKTLGKGKGKTFTLHVEGGSFSGNDCVGLLGQNGSGKTTFMELLSGKFDPKDADGNRTQNHEGSFRDIGVAYKPQVYAPKLRKFRGTTQFLFEKYVNHACADRLFRLMVMNPLRITQLWELNVCDLSGGELQRVAIAMCLAQKANVYLLDEPSAGLDCEQRVQTAKVIRRWVVNHLGKMAMIVEHDFVMASALSDKVVLYEGNPGIECTAKSPQGLVNGFNRFLKQLDVTLRRDPENFRPRVNKRGSIKDQEQKSSGQFFVWDADE